MWILKFLFFITLFGALGIPWVLIFTVLLFAEFLFVIVWTLSFQLFFKLSPPITVGTLSGIIGPFPRWPMKPYDLVEPECGIGSRNSFRNPHVGHEEVGSSGGSGCEGE